MRVHTGCRSHVALRPLGEAASLLAAVASSPRLPLFILMAWLGTQGPSEGLAFYGPWLPGSWGLFSWGCYPLGGLGPCLQGLQALRTNAVRLTAQGHAPKPEVQPLRTQLLLRALEGGLKSQLFVGSLP